MIIFTVTQIEIPVDMIPDKWSNFEFWSELYKNKQEAMLLMISMKKGVVDLGQIASSCRAFIAGIINIIEVAVLQI